MRSLVCLISISKQGHLGVYNIQYIHGLWCTNTPVPCSNISGQDSCTHTVPIMSEISVKVYLMFRKLTNFSNLWVFSKDIRIKTWQFVEFDYQYP